MRLSNRLTIPLAVVAVLTAVGLPHWPLWRAELWTWMLVGRDFGGMWGKLAEDFHPPGYFFLLWALLDSDSPDWMLRFPSLVGAVGTVWLAGIAARRWFGGAEGFFAAMALALSPFVIVYGGVARGYALLAFAAGGLVVAGAQIVEGHRVRAAALGIFLSGAAALYVHYAAAAALVATALGIAAGLWARPDRGAGRWRFAAVALAAIPVVFAPWVLGPMSRQQIDVAPLPRSFDVLGYLAWPVGHHQPVGNWALLALATLGAALLLRRRAPVDRLLLAWPLCGIVIPLVLSNRTDLQTKFYVQSWFLPAWGVLVGVGAAAVARHLAPFRTAAWVFGVALAASAFGPLLALWRLPAAPFEVLNGSTVYDVRREVRLLEAVLPDIPPASFPQERFSVYARYIGALPTTSPAPSWLYRRRDDAYQRSVYTTPEFAPCSFPHAFFVTLTVLDPVQCDAIVSGIEAAVVHDPYPPFLLELASRERMYGSLPAAVAFAERAAAVPTDWSDPTVFLAQLYAQNGDADLALHAVEQGIAASFVWRNYFVTKELFGLRSELLWRAGREQEARVAAECSNPATPIEPCIAQY